jgi:hypothetical protein
VDFNLELVIKNNFLTAKSQIAAVPSVDPVANIVPWGENRTSLTAYVWCLNGDLTSSKNSFVFESQFQSRIKWSLKESEFDSYYWKYIGICQKLLPFFNLFCIYWEWTRYVVNVNTAVNHRL